ncbi:hypothetical protein BJ138DRAFT_1129539 [Hygrophoropsis aurantiaca]|uniref:Uncharacterized protein n=1 Tax=Hygrophoropsis aurantiaca TaxID=72124 RepID=A0ACB8A1V8_9AGAM|nr:hypothetical protein BJ138DRAFT_1129539 [Hygrophoropsis aurantiaca]
MSSGLMQDPMPSSPSAGNGPRFRPYASPNHQVTKGRYITSNDPRGYIPVYEYPLNGQWIMMDIDDGYILWTGIWKALGNSKADIVKMIDSQPDLAPVIRRVRGGYLKIQGTWMPYEVALRLSRRVAWPIRDDLVPLFGPTFPDTCLSPDQPGFGQVVNTTTGRRRARRATQAVAPAPSASAQPSWSSVAPINGSSAQHNPMGTAQPMPPSPMMFRDGPSYPQSYRAPRSGDTLHASPPLSHGYLAAPSSSSTSPLMRERSRSRYSPYPSASVPSRKASVSTTDSLSLDIPSISLHEPEFPQDRHGRLPGESIVLPPIQPLNHPRSGSHALYALPPISAMEDLRGISSHDSAAVLQRLKMDDELKPESGPTADYRVSRQRSMSASYHRVAEAHPGPNSWPKGIASAARASYGDRQHLRANSSSAFMSVSPELSPSFHSSHDGSSTGGASPVSPSTPRSTDMPSIRNANSGSKEHDRRVHAGYHASPMPSSAPEHRVLGRKSGNTLSTGTDPRLSACRHSCSKEDDTDSDSSMRPIRPW